VNEKNIPMNIPKNPELTVLHIYNYHQDRIGGPFRIVPELLQAQQECGVNAALLTIARNAKKQQAAAFPLFYIEDLQRSRQLDGLPPPFNAPDLLHFHSCYLPMSAVLARQAEKKNTPYLITPHGAMNRKARAQKRFKKMLGYLLFQNHMNTHAAAFHFLTQAEAELSREKTMRRPFFIVPNGTDLRVENTGPAPGATDPTVPLRLLFLGRLDIHHKGLDMLLEGLSFVKNHHPNQAYVLALVGPDHHNANKHRLEEMVCRYGLQEQVKIPGSVTGSTKEAVFRWAHAFVHTSRFEGHPTAVLEALAHGLPCLLTPGTNMAHQVAQAGAGWVVQPDAKSIATALLNIVSQRSRLPQKGKTARSFAEQEFDWQRIAKKMIHHYRSVGG
jgi:glycosyltransferase involved in cell wall biosynthesis